MSSDVNCPVDEIKNRSRIYCNINCYHNDVLQAYVWNNNIYLKASPTAEAVQITQNGEENKILNGIPDWVYEGNYIKRVLLSIIMLKLWFIVITISFLTTEKFKLIKVCILKEASILI